MRTVSVVMSGPELNAVNRYRRDRHGPLVSRSAAIRELVQLGLKAAGLGGDDMAELEMLAQNYRSDLDRR
jgi:hypothetical protein